MTRVIGGTAGGRRLAVPAGTGTRPTSDRAREGLFSTLESLRGSLAGAAVLDLYAGSGAVGLEALSRGAARAVFVEADRRVAAVLRDNAARSGLAGAEVHVDRVERWVRGPAGAGGGFDVVFADPPYALADDELVAVMGDLRAGGWIGGGGVVVVERRKGAAWRWPEGLSAVRERRYGEATLWYGRAAE